MKTYVNVSDKSKLVTKNRMKVWLKPGHKIDLGPADIGFIGMNSHWIVPLREDQVAAKPVRPVKSVAAKVVAEAAVVKSCAAEVIAAVAEALPAVAVEAVVETVTAGLPLESEPDLEPETAFEPTLEPEGESVVSEAREEVAAEKPAKKRRKTKK